MEHEKFEKIMALKGQILEYSKICIALEKRPLVILKFPNIEINMPQNLIPELKEAAERILTNLETEFTEL